jgi:adenylate kinase family enzyme
MSRIRKTGAFMLKDEGNSQSESEICVKSDQMITIAYIAGCPGSGKTTLAGKLYKKLDWRFVNKDYIKRNLLEKYNYDQLADPHERDTVRDRVVWEALNEFFQEIEDAIEEGRRSVIVDNWGYVNNHGSIEPTLDHIRGIMRKHPGKARLKVILCRASKETRDQRIKQRGSQLQPYLNELPETPDDERAEQMLAHLKKEDILELDTGADRDEADWNEIVEREVLGHLNTRAAVLV